MVFFHLSINNKAKAAKPINDKILDNIIFTLYKKKKKKFWWLVKLYQL